MTKSCTTPLLISSDFMTRYLKMAFKDIQDHLRLEKEPNGWAYANGSGTCKFCGYYFETNDFWFDKFGFKCKFCQRAVNEAVIPDRSAEITRNGFRWRH